MAGTDDFYDFDAPQCYFDFTEQDDIEVDESYFDRNSVGEPPAPKKSLPKSPEHTTTGAVSGRQQASPPPPTPTPAGDATRSSLVSNSPEDEVFTEETKGATPVREHTGDQEPRRRTGGVLDGVARVGVRQSPRLAAIAKALRRNAAARRSSGGTQTSSRPHETHTSKVHKVRARQRVIPRAPVNGLNAQDEAELNAIVDFKQKMNKNKKKTEAHAHGQPLRPTRPQEFHFATDSRVKEPARVEAEQPVEFTKSLRSSSSSSLNKDAAKGRTIPQPFKLSESRKARMEEPNKFVSDAELNLKFYTKTPQRFRSKRAGEEYEATTREEKKARASVTIPQTPRLTSTHRTRSVNYLTHEERELQAYEEAKKHAFKANPVNKKALGEPSTGYHVEKKVPTMPEPFNITDSKRPQPRVSKFLDTSSQFGGSNLSLASLPHGGIPVKWNKTSTKVEPFSFDARDKATMQHKQEKIKDVIEKEKSLAEFHAQPMPLFEAGVQGVPAKKPPTPTRARPFNLLSDQRGAIKQQEFKRHVEEESQQDEERRKFHAQGDDVLHKRPFIPEKSKKPLTDISGFTLNTEIRAGERYEYELHRKVTEDEMLSQKREREEQKAAEEAVEIARLRKETVHKAKPVRKFKPMIIQPNQRAPTVPKTPTFATDSRLRSRSQANSTLNISSATYTAE